MNDNKTPATGARERLDYNTRVMLACIALAAVLAGALANQLNSGKLAMLFYPGAAAFGALVAVIGYFLVKNHKLLKQLEKKP